MDGQVEAEFYAEFGRKLKVMRKAAKMRSGALAIEVGVHRNTISRWENGTGSITLMEAMRVCMMLNCHMSMIQPSEAHLWAEGYLKLKRERESGFRAMKRERDPMLTDAEEMKLRRQS